MSNLSDADSRSRRRRSAVWGAAGLLWLVAVVGGLAAVARYDNTPGTAAETPARWPTHSRLTHDDKVPTLVMVAHPLCSCTRASLAELAEIMARTQGRVKAYVVFASPRGLEGNSARTDLWDRAARIPGVVPVADPDGREADAFGAVTSGQVSLYSPGGALLFTGGTTRSRGHEGDNDGRRSLVALITDQRPEQTHTDVFGCAIRGADEPRAGFTGEDRDGTR
jgi:hypothetical protein